MGITDNVSRRPRPDNTWLQLKFRYPRQMESAPRSQIQLIRLVYYNWLGFMRLVENGGEVIWFRQILRKTLNKIRIEQRRTTEDTTIKRPTKVRDTCELFFTLTLTQKAHHLQEVVKASCVLSGDSVSRQWYSRWIMFGILELSKFIGGSWNMWWYTRE